MTTNPPNTVHHPVLSTPPANAPFTGHLRGSLKTHPQIAATPTAENTRPSDEARIRQLIADQASAICAKDLERLMSHYAAEVSVFDVIPPFQTRGADAWQRTWEACLPCLPAASGTETRDLVITVSGDLALAHWLWRFTGIAEDHPAAMWFRSTAGYQRKPGGWRIMHEHCSVPFDPKTSQAVFALEL